MTEQELSQLTLTSARALIARRELSPVELTTAVLQRINRLDGRMRAFITVTADSALERARRAEREAGRSVLPLHGIPVSLKDVYDTRDIRTTAGSKVFASRIPTEDSHLASKLNDAGAVLVGKTNLHEFAFGVTTVNPHYGTTRNAWNPQRIAGGSSGGSATALALGMGLGSLGTDTGGSIRIPAALSGIVGLKPTYGLANLRGVVPLSPTLDHAGPMARTVEDAAILLDVMLGRAAGESGILPGEVATLRIGVPRTYFYERLAPDVDGAVHAALERLEGLGARIVEVALPSASLQADAFTQIAAPEAYCFHEPYLATQPHLYGEDARKRIESGREMLSINYVRAQQTRGAMKAEFERAFQEADVIVTPAVPIPAPEIEALSAPWGAGSETATEALTRFTRLFNLAGVPAISVPCGFTTEGLPIGLQIAGRACDESTVLRVAYAYEQDAGWFRRSPEITENV